MTAVGPSEAQSVGSQGGIRWPGEGIYKNPVEAGMVRTTVVLSSRQILDLSEGGGCGIFCQIGVEEGPRESTERWVAQRLPDGASGRRTVQDEDVLRRRPAGHWDVWAHSSSFFPHGPLCPVLWASLRASLSQLRALETGLGPSVTVWCHSQGLENRALFDNRHVGCPQVFPLTDKSATSIFPCVFPALDSSDCLCWVGGIRCLVSFVF